MTIEEHYRKVKTTARQLSHRDSLYVIWAYCQSLQVNGFQIPGDIEVANQFLNAQPRRGILAEWTLEQMAREVIRHADEEPRRGRTLRQWGNVATIANALRDLEGAIYAQLVGGQRIQLEMMRIAHRQFVWQQHRFNWKPIIRYYKLFNTPQIVAHAQQATGLTLDEIYLVGLAYLGIFFGQPRTTRQIDVQIPGLTQQHLDRFLAFTSLTRTELANRLRAEHALDEGFAYRYSSLREFPLVQFSHQGRDEVACPIPTLLFWRMTTGLYYSLKDVPGFPTAFGDSFQSYVGEVLRKRITSQQMAVLDEQEYHVGLRRKDSVDWIIQHGDEAALFVECKTKRLTWASKAGLTDLSALEQDIRKLAGAVAQTYKTIADYRAGLYPHLAFVEERRIYPAIVTLEDWYFFGIDMPTRLDAAVRVAMETAGLSAAWLDEMPYAILSVHEFEKAAGVINTVGIHPFISGKVLDPEFRRWGFAAYCNERYPNEVAALPRLFRDEFDAMFSDLA
ncbi:hypothetical protein [Tardiphaga sp. 367_B4_N1_1]|uniref:hypothetical protein n=1 Tax=Tardiphaga sp. 367_B4_N1_1 TaxID=3240777 RepID=UPI003F2275B3